ELGLARTERKSRRQVMTQQAMSAFSIDDWKQEQIDERGGITLARAHVKKTFRGDLQATSTAELLLAGTSTEGSAAYVGLERLEGTLNGRSGSFLLHHSATSARGEQSASWTIVP